MDFDRLYIEDLLENATRGHLPEHHDVAPDDPAFTTQALGEEGDDPDADITTQALGEEGDDPDADTSSDVPFSVEPDDGSGDDDLGDDDLGDDGFGVA